MTDSSPVTMQELSLFGSAIVAVGTIIASGLCWLWTRLNANTADLAQHKLDSARELADYKLEAAKGYATNQTVIAVEGRLATSIDRLADRIERAISGRPDHSGEPAHR